MNKTTYPPYDFDAEPFITNGRAIIESLRMNIGTSGVEISHSEYKATSYDLYSLYFDASLFSPIFTEFLIKAFADKVRTFPPSEVVYGGKHLITFCYKDRFLYCDEKPKPFMWGKEDTLPEKDRLKAYLNDYLIRFFYDYFCY
jgi:hypothetical protein